MGVIGSEVGKFLQLEGVTAAVLILGIVLAAFLLIAIYASRYKKVPPDKAMVVYGRKTKAGRAGYQVITGGGKWILPIVEAYEFLPLDVRTLDVVVTEIVTDVKQSGAKINIKAVAQVRISDDPNTLRTAASQLRHNRADQINETALKTLEGHVRSICATLSVEEVNSDRDAIATQIQGLAANDLKNMGLEIRSFVIKEIEDEHGYLDALGVKRTEEVKRDARIGKANANREATIAEALAAQLGEKARADARAAEADGERRRLIAIADGERERLTRVATGDAERIRQTGTAEADIIRLKGEAEAYAIKATGLATAEAMRAKAEAWEMYGRAAVTQLIVEKLPEIVGNAAKSLEGTSKLIIMGERGPSSLVGSVVDIAAQAPALVKALAGKLKDVMK